MRVLNNNDILKYTIIFSILNILLLTSILVLYDLYHDTGIERLKEIIRKEVTVK